MYRAVFCREVRMWKIIYPKAIQKQLDELPWAHQRQICETLQNMRWAITPRSLYPVQIGDYRVLCSMDAPMRTIKVAEISLAVRPI